VRVSICRTRTVRLLPLLVVALFAGIACEAGPAPATPPISPGTASAPREVNLIARDYAFLPETLDLVPGERVVLHVINGGLVTHEAILGDDRVQDAWEVAEAAVAAAPPGPTPVVSVPPDVAGVRIVVPSGQRVDLDWTVPADAGRAEWIVGCHIAGHWERGMQIPVRWVQPNRNAPATGSPDA
jgi:FtsP/CotA-like multicopper oxidase with cupredoxin domain